MVKNVLYHTDVRNISMILSENIYIAEATVKLEHCSSEEVVADIFTKSLSAVPFTKLRKMLWISSIKKIYV